MFIHKKLILDKHHNEVQGELQPSKCSVQSSACTYVHKCNRSIPIYRTPCSYCTILHCNRITARTVYNGKHYMYSIVSFAVLYAIPHSTGPCYNETRIYCYHLHPTETHQCSHTWLPTKPWSRDDRVLNYTHHFRPHTSNPAEAFLKQVPDDVSRTSRVAVVCGDAAAYTLTSIMGRCVDTIGSSHEDLNRKNNSQQLAQSSHKEDNKAPHHWSVKRYEWMYITKLRKRNHMNDTGNNESNMIYIRPKLRSEIQKIIQSLNS